MRPQNLLFIFSDQHDPQFLGAAGHRIVRTPSLDALARRGTRFVNATTPCPICVPARASLATGRWVHDNRCWDNGQPYDGSIPSWGHRLIERGHRVAAIGKLHYRSDADDNGFSEKIETMNVVEGIGDRLGWLRRRRFERGAARDLSRTAARGDSAYADYDRRILEESQEWLRKRAAEPADKPWVLFVGFVMPHLPLIAPIEFFDLYRPDSLPPPRLYAPELRPRHPWIEWLTQVLPYDKYFDDRSRKTAIAAYHGMVSFLDHNIGQLLQTLQATGLDASTRVIYTSDHGEMLGNHGIWGKSCLYQESVGVPMIMAGEGVPAGTTANTEVSLVDCYPTILEAVGVAPPQEDRGLPGRSLFGLIGKPDPERAGFSEYHAAASPSGAFMVRRGRWKYVHYAGMPPQLFDLEADPIEARDLGEDPAHAAARAEMEALLRRIVDPDRANAQAFADQEARIQAHGGPERVLAIGDFGHTPTPYEKAHFAPSLEA
jgi:choline-sulfatase